MNAKGEVDIFIFFNNLDIIHDVTTIGNTDYGRGKLLFCIRIPIPTYLYDTSLKQLTFT